MPIYLRLLFNQLKPIASFVKKLGIVVIVFYVAITLFMYFVNEKKPTFTDPAKEAKVQIYKTINSPELSKTEDGKTYVGIYSFAMCMTIGEACDPNPYSARNGINHTVFGGMSRLMAMPFTNMPSSGIYWASSGLQNAGLISNSYAAEGIGFAALAPFQNLWLMFRNLVFFLYILVMIAIGFMIMFRAKINPQTVISIENALPKIVISMILVTFSYAIAGFMIDLMYVTMGVIFALFQTSPANGVSELKEQAYFNGKNALMGTFMADNHVWKLAEVMYDFIPNEISGVINAFATSSGSGTIVWLLSFFGVDPGVKAVLPVAAINGAPAVPGTPGVAAKIKPNFAGDAINFFRKFSPIGLTMDRLEHGAATPIFNIVMSIIGVIVVNVMTNSIIGKYITISIIGILLVISLVFIFFRILFMFLGVYIQIILFVILSPLMLALEAIPGKSMFMEWLKILFFNLITFPIFLILILISRAIMATNSSSVLEASLWQPPFIGGIEAQGFKTLVAGILIFSSPELIKNFKQMMGYKPAASPFNLGSFFTGVTGIVGGAFGIANQYQSLRSTLLGAHAAEGLASEGGKNLPNFMKAVFKVRK